MDIYYSSDTGKSQQSNAQPDILYFKYCQLDGARKPFAVVWLFMAGQGRIRYFYRWRLRNGKLRYSVSYKSDLLVYYHRIKMYRRSTSVYNVCKCMQIYAVYLPEGGAASQYSVVISQLLAREERQKWICISLFCGIVFAMSFFILHIQLFLGGISFMNFIIISFKI